MAAVSDIDKSLDQIIKENKKQIRLQAFQAVRKNKSPQSTGKTTPKKAVKKSRAGVVATGRASGGRNGLGKRNLIKGQRAIKGNPKVGKQGLNRPKVYTQNITNKQRRSNTPNKKNNAQLKKPNQQQSNKNNILRRQGQYKQPGRTQNQNNQNQVRQLQNRRKQNRQNQMNARRGLQQNKPSKTQNGVNTNGGQRQSTPGRQNQLKRTQQWKNNQGTFRPNQMKKQRKWNQRGRGTGMKISLSNNNNLAQNKTLNERFSSLGGQNRNGRRITFS